MKMTIDSDVTIPMRDGVRLSCDIFRPDSRRRHPALLYVPYTDRRTRNGLALIVNPITAVERGYAVVIADCRGTFRSEGQWSPLHGQGRDGFDMVEWIAGQDWCDGAVGVYGASGMGATALQTTLMSPPHLQAAFLLLTGGSYHHGWAYTSGVFELGFALHWARVMGAYQRKRNLADNPDFVAPAPIQEWDAARALPLIDDTVIPRSLAPWYADWLAHTQFDDYWREVDAASNIANIKVPILQFGAWYDLFFPGQISVNEALAAHPDARVRTESRFLIGPWAHNAYLGFAPTTAGSRDFDSTADSSSRSMTPLALDWFDKWLRGDTSKQINSRYFMMGDNVWRESPSWPPISRQQEWFLSSGGRANTRHGDGVLKPTIAGVNPQNDRFLYDPFNPVPTVGGATISQELCPDGVQDQRKVEEREDVLVYSSGILDQDTRIAGTVSVVLFASTSGRDTDFTAKLVDVEPEGFCANISEGIVRARYREGTHVEKLVPRETILEYKIRLNDVAHCFRAGHRIRLEISSSNFPKWARNLNCETHSNFATADEAQVATQQVYHDQLHPSRLVVSLID